MEASGETTQKQRHDEFLIGRFVAARSAGNEATAVAVWNELVDLNFDRVVGMVRSQSNKRLSPEEQDDAVQDALIKLIKNMIRTFNGTSMGEWVNSTRTLVHGVCIDVQRRNKRHSDHRVNLHSDNDSGDGFTPAVNDVLLDRAALDAADEDAAAIYDYGARFLGWALPQITEKRRAVLVLDLEGMPVEEIQSRLEMSRDAVYANRSRAIVELTRLQKEFEPV